MAEKTDAFLFYRSYYDAAKRMNQRDKAAYFMALCAYIFDEAEPRLSGMAEVGWILTLPTLEANLRRRKNGAKGGRPATKEKPVVTESESENETTGYEVDAQDAKPNKGQEKKDKESFGRQGQKDKGQGSAPIESWPPSFAEVSAFVTARGGTKRQARAFYDQYQQLGWIAEGRPVENWKGLCTNFLRYEVLDQEMAFEAMRAEKMRMVALYDGGKRLTPPPDV